MVDERIVLPSIAEIEASADILSDPSRSFKVVRVREHFAVKVGTSIAPLEAENMKFVAANSKVPVPKVHDHFVDPETQKRYIIMDYVPGYFGNLNRTPYYEGILSTIDHDPSISGLLKCLGQGESPHYVRLLREPIQRTLRGHKTVFTHADLQPKNVMVEQKGVCEGGSPDYQITLIDWNLAGWYPEYWDYCISTVYCQGKPE
ncbi:kinase-like domain-containing protein [Aspergillus novoparasiticus]|uniref:Kinase-like domain-containing protein n=1 Tax=Aspergillus novoparasiticus TaxID=986946 RepID=A0A5N6ED75_9EURO|nr:kinase-like domain-containing protein [Aspergillus novoparasiticus]